MLFVKTTEEKPNGLQSLLNLLIFGKIMQVTFDETCCTGEQH